MAEIWLQALATPRRLTTEQRLARAAQWALEDPSVRIQDLAVRAGLRVSVLRAEIVQGNMPGVADAQSADGAFLERFNAARAMRREGYRIEAISRLLDVSVSFVERLLGLDAETPAALEKRAPVPGECYGCECGRPEDYSTNPITSQLIRVAPCRRRAPASGPTARAQSSR